MPLDSESDASEASVRDSFTNSSSLEGAGALMSGWGTLEGRGEPFGSGGYILQDGDECGTVGFNFQVAIGTPASTC